MIHSNIYYLLYIRYFARCWGHLAKLNRTIIEVKALVELETW